MTAEERIYSILKHLCDGRVYPLEGYQAGAFPYIAYQRISTIPYNELCGDTGASHARIQVDINGDSYEQVRQLAREVRNELKADGVFQNQQDLPDQERSIYRIVQDYLIFEEGF